jgi:hypothetical protein
MSDFLKTGALRLVLGLLAVLLASCGGGGGGGSPADTTPVVQGPPETAAVLANTSDDAAQAVISAVAAADAAASNSNSLSGVFALFGAPTGLQRAPDSSHKHATAVQSAACTDVLEAPCTGSASIDTNLSPSASSAPAGTFIDVSFNALSGGLAGSSVTLNGRMRIDFVAAFNLANPQPTGLDLQLLFDQLRGSVNGAAFGPVSESLRLQVDAQGNSSVIAGGKRYSGISGVTVSNATNYNIAGSSVRTSHWRNAGTYVDLNLTQWQVVNGRPALGSMATLSAGSGSVVLQVTSSSTSSVVYAVALTLNGSTTHYVVTATYPAGGAAPTYMATLAV